MTAHDPFQLDIARHVWATRYRAPCEVGIVASWRRVARAVAD